MARKHRLFAHIAIVLVVTVTGAILLYRAAAATFAVQAEAEQGTLAGEAAIMPDDGASDGRAVLFGKTGFNHPGVLVSRQQLDFVKARIAAGEQPWAGALVKLKSSGSGTANYTPHPRAVVDCGPFSNPDNGCSEESADAIAAYSQALIWYYTGDTVAAQKSVEIMNAWSGTLTGHTGSNAPLQSAWTAEMMVRAAEIMRYSSPLWTQAQTDSFTAMLNNVFLAMFQSTAAQNAYKGSNGNWHLSAIDAMANIAVFTENRTLFNQAVSEWRGRVPAYIYMTTDNGGNGLPVPPQGGVYNDTTKLKCFWLNVSGTACTAAASAQLNFAVGHAQETCRDLSHTTMGLASMAYAAETARIQNVDLYGEQQARIVAGLENTARFINGEPYPSGFCNNSTTLVPGSTFPLAYEVSFNQYAQRQRLALPETKKLIAFRRTSGGNTGLQVAWETLTHGSDLTHAP